VNIGIISYLPIWPLSGGSSLRVFRYTKEFCRRGHNVSLVCPFSVESEEIRKKLGQIKIYPFKLYKMSRFTKYREIKYSLYPLLIAPMVLKIAKKDKLEIIISHNCLPAFSAILAKKIYNIPYVLDIVDLMSGYLKYSGNLRALVSRLLSIFEKGLIKSADKIIAITKSMQDVLVSQKIADRSKITIIPDGVDLDLFTPWKDDKKREGDGPVILFAGVLDRYQGVDILLKSVPYVLKELPKAKFFILGKGIELESLRNKSKNMGIENSVFFPGWVNNEKLVDYIKMSDLGIVCHPKNLSTETMFPIKLLHYWAMGKPVIVPDLKQLRETVVEGVNGLFFKPSNYKDMAKKIIDIFSKYDIGEMGMMGRRKVESDFDWDKLSEKFVKCCENFL